MPSLPQLDGLHLGRNSDSREPPGPVHARARVCVCVCVCVLAARVKYGLIRLLIQVSPYTLLL